MKIHDQFCVSIDIPVYCIGNNTCVYSMYCLSVKYLPRSERSEKIATPAETCLPTYENWGVTFLFLKTWIMCASTTCIFHLVVCNLTRLMQLIVGQAWTRHMKNVDHLHAHYCHQNVTLNLTSGWQEHHTQYIWLCAVHCSSTPCVLRDVEVPMA